jgi:two-component system NtrC family response regulator
VALVLIVDDDVSITTSLTLLLKQAGHTSRVAAGPAEALSLLERGGFALVLQDMNFSRQTTGPREWRCSPRSRRGGRSCRWC